MARTITAAEMIQTAPYEADGRIEPHPNYAPSAEDVDAVNAAAWHAVEPVAGWGEHTHVVAVPDGFDLFDLDTVGRSVYYLARIEDGGAG